MSQDAFLVRSGSSAFRWCCVPSDSLAVHFSSDSMEWGTDPDTFAELNARYGPFVIDACASAKNAKCKRFFTKEDDLFKQTLDACFFKNPPYGDPEEPCKADCKKLRCKTCEEVGCRIGKPECKKHRGHHISVYVPGIGDFMAFARQTAIDGHAAGCCLVPARTDTRWWRQTVLAPHGKPVKQWQDFAEGRFGVHWSEGLIVEFILRPGREKFVPDDGRKVFSAPFPSATVYYRPAPKIEVSR
jgi:hypothetical protein